MVLSGRARKILLLSLALYRIRRKRRTLVPAVINKRLKTEEDAFYKLLSEMRLTDIDLFVEFYRVTPKQFDHLLNIVGKKITANQANNREPISARDRLAITLRYLASGESMISLSSVFKVSGPSVTTIVFNVCRALWESLMPLVIPTPDASTWEKVATQMNESFQFPHCIGAIGGKFVKQACGSKGERSVSFVAICDREHKFLIVEIAKYEDQIKRNLPFKTTDLGTALSKGELNLPSPVQIIGTNQSIPFVFAGHNRFPLSVNVLTPYPDKEVDVEKAIFNYRLSRCNNLIENAFGVMCSRFHIFSKPIHAKVPKVQAITMAVACLHNYLIANDGDSPDSTKYYCPEGFCDYEDADGTVHQGEWREHVEDGAMVDIDFDYAHGYTFLDSGVRNALTTYFCDNGAVPWQLERAFE